MAFAANPPAQAQFAVIDIGAITQLIVQVQQLEAALAGRAEQPLAGAAGLFRDHRGARNAVAPLGSQSQLLACAIGRSS